MIEGKRILITGMAGSIGSELLRQLAPKNVVMGIDLNETGLFNLVEEYQQAGHKVFGYVGDIRNKDDLALIFDQEPEIIFHCAARKHVTPSEENPMEAITTNVNGTHNLLQYPGRFIYISTDKVVNAVSVLGLTKKLGEVMVRRMGGVCVRFGNVLGSQGSVIPIWQKQIQEGKPVTVTDERMTRYMMTIEEAVELVIEAAEVGEGGDIFILDLEKKQINVLELAKQIINASGTEATIQIIGARPGEALSEELMTSHEKEIAVKKGKFWIIKAEKASTKTDESIDQDRGLGVLGATAE